MNLPNLPPAFMLNIQLNCNTMFSVSFASVEDMVKDDVWKAATGNLHEHLKAWLAKEAEKDGN